MLLKESLSDFFKQTAWDSCLPGCAAHERLPRRHLVHRAVPGRRGFDLVPQEPEQPSEGGTWLRGAVQRTGRQGHGRRTTAPPGLHVGDSPRRSNGLLRAQQAGRLLVQGRGDRQSCREDRGRDWSKGMYKAGLSNRIEIESFIYLFFLNQFFLLKSN